MRTLIDMYRRVRAYFRLQLNRAQLSRQVLDYRSSAGTLPVVLPDTIEEKRVRECAEALARKVLDTIAAMYGDTGAFTLLGAHLEAEIAQSRVKVDRERVALLLGQLDYLTEYTRQELGVYDDSIASEVHRRSMDSVRPRALTN